MALKVPTRIYNIYLQIIQSIKFDQLGFEMPDISCDGKAVPITNYLVNIL
jgi:hypothetical protein